MGTRRSHAPRAEEIRSHRRLIDQISHGLKESTPNSETT